MLENEFKRIAITGAKGTIGIILKEGLSKDYQITSLDLPEVDITNKNQIAQILPGHSAIIHLAWNTKIENMSSGTIDPNNTLMTYNVYDTSLKAGVQRVIMASSVHAQVYSSNSEQSETIKTSSLPTPDSPYGANKVFMEALGRHYASKGLEVVCIRFGRVREDDDPGIEDPNERIVWLSKEDAINLIKKCLEAEKIPNNFTIINGVSNNEGKIHDTSNPVGWVPKDNYANK